MQRTLKYIGWVISGLIALVLILYLLFQIPLFQTWAGKKALAILTKDIDAQIDVSRVKIVFFNKLEIDDFSIVSQDTLVYAKSANARLSLKGLLSKQLSINSVKVSDGVFNLIKESDSTTNLSRIFPPKEKQSKGNTNIALKKIEVERFRFNLLNPFGKSQYVEGKIDWRDFHARDITVKATDFEYAKDTIRAKIARISLTEQKSGANVKDISGSFEASNNFATLSNALINLNNSKLKPEFLTFRFDDTKAFNNFVEQVQIEAKFKSSYLEFADLGYFAALFLGSDLALNFDTQVKGTINNLHVKNLSATNKGGLTHISLSNLNLNGLPNAANTKISADINNITTNGKDLADILTTFTPSGKKIDYLANLPDYSTFQYSGTLGGKISNLQIQGSLTNGNGVANVKGYVNTGVAKGSNTELYMALNTENFDVAPFAGTKLFGRITAHGNVRVDAPSGKSSSSSATVYIDTLSVKALEFNNYRLTNLYATGKYQEESFDGKVICHDPAIDMLFQGIISVKDEKKYNFYANIPYADLYALKLYDKDTIAQFSGTIISNITQNQDDIFGYINALNTTFTNSSGEYKIGNINANSEYSNNKYRIALNSSFAQARYLGDKNISDFVEKIKKSVILEHFSNILSNSELKRLTEEKNPAVKAGQKQKSKKEEPLLAELEEEDEYEFMLHTGDSRGVCAFISPGLYIQKGSQLKVKLDSDNHYNLQISSGRIAHKENYLKNLTLNVNDKDNHIYAALFSSEAIFAGLKVDSTMVRASGDDNTLNVAVRFHNDTTGVNKTNLNTMVRFLKDTTLYNNGYGQLHIDRPISIKIAPSDITIKGNRWSFNPSEILYSDSITFVNNLFIYNKEQSLKAHGSLSGNLPDSLGIEMNRFDVAIIDQFLEKPFKIRGLMSGAATLSMNSLATKMYANFVGDSMYVYDSPVGRMEISGEWAREEKRYNLALNTYHNGSSKLNIEGYYKPEGSYLDLSSTLNNLSLTYFEPMLSSLVSNTSGSMNGKIRLFGPTKNLSITGQNCSFNNYKFTLDYLNVPYTLNGPIEITEKEIKFVNDILTDAYGGKATIRGGITHKNFRDIGVNVSLRLDNILSLNTTEKLNEDFYGTAYANGTLNITGNTERLNISMNGTTRPKTFVHIPVSGASKASVTNILTFVTEEKIIEEDPYEAFYKSTSPNHKKPLELAVNLQVNATPDADIWLEVDKSTGDIIKAKGNGRITLNIDPARDIFDMRGNYRIQQGSYHFVLMGITSRDFEVQEGSSITLNGKVENTALDITAMYKTKAAINRLISDTSSVNTNRQVNASIIVGGTLATPQIKFKIDIPDLDPNTKVQVESALNSDDKMQKQFASLLAFGSFVPDVQSGIVTANSAIYSNAYGLLTNQLNKVFMQLGIPLDLGFNYTPGQESRNDAFEFAVSTQLFNNRVVINGSMGNDPHSNTTGRDVKGNIDVEVKMDRRGQLRMTFFSHSTDSYSNYLDESQRTGIGVAYQREFNSIRDIFRKKSASQKEYEKMLKAREKEERKAARRQRREERKKEREEQKEKTE